MNTPKVSIILLVFNSNRHLEYCIKSILSQTYRNFELLIINDGSTNDTLDRCQKFMTIDKRIRIINKKNEGIEKSRIRGINEALGEYLMFCDHDDWYDSKALEILLNTSIIDSSDIVVGNYNEKIYSWLPIAKKGLSLKTNVLDHKTFIKKYYINFFGYNLFNVSTWGKLYKTEIFKKNVIKTIGYNLTEDVAINIQVFPLAHKISFISNVVYFHRFGGLTSRPNTKTLLENYSSLYDLKFEFIRKYHVEKAFPFINYELTNILIHFIKLSINYNLCSEKVILERLSQFRNSEQGKKLEDFYKNNNDADFFAENYLLQNWAQIIKYYKKKKIRQIPKIFIKKIFRLLG